MKFLRISIVLIAPLASTFPFAQEESSSPSAPPNPASPSPPRYDGPSQPFTQLALSINSSVGAVEVGLSLKGILDVIGVPLYMLPITYGIGLLINGGKVDQPRKATADIDDPTVFIPNSLPPNVPAPYEYPGRDPADICYSQGPSPNCDFLIDDLFKYIDPAVLDLGIPILTNNLHKYPTEESAAKATAHLTMGPTNSSGSDSPSRRDLPGPPLRPSPNVLQGKSVDELFAGLLSEDDTPGTTLVEWAYTIPGPVGASLGPLLDSFGALLHVVPITRSFAQIWGGGWPRQGRLVEVPLPAGLPNGEADGFTAPPRACENGPSEGCSAYVQEWAEKVKGVWRSFLPQLVDALKATPRMEDAEGMKPVLPGGVWQDGEWVIYYR